MTIEEAIERLKDDTPDTSDAWCDALDMATRSLEAWEKVKADIDKLTEIHNDGEFYIKNIDVKRIIVKHLKEVRMTDNQRQYDEIYHKAENYDKLTGAWNNVCTDINEELEHLDEWDEYDSERIGAYRHVLRIMKEYRKEAGL